MIYVVCLFFFFFNYIHSLFLIFCKNHVFFISPNLSYLTKNTFFSFYACRFNRCNFNVTTSTRAHGAHMVKSVYFLKMHISWTLAVVSRCFNPCVSFLCTLLYTGSSVLQINESPVCSLERVPQACDWLLACLQVTLPFCKLHQSTTSSMLLILLIKQTEVVFFSFKECVLSCTHFKSCVIDGAWALFDQLFCVICNQTGSCWSFNHSFLFIFCYVCHQLYLLQPLSILDIDYLFLQFLKQPHKHIQSRCCAGRSSVA